MLKGHRTIHPKKVKFTVHKYNSNTIFFFKEHSKAQEKLNAVNEFTIKISIAYYIKGTDWGRGKGNQSLAIKQF